MTKRISGIYIKNYQRSINIMDMASYEQNDFVIDEMLNKVY